MTNIHSWQPDVIFCLSFLGMFDVLRFLSSILHFRYEVVSTLNFFQSATFELTVYKKYSTFVNDFSAKVIMTGFSSFYCFNSQRGLRNYLRNLSLILHNENNVFDLTISYVNQLQPIFQIPRKTVDTIFRQLSAKVEWIKVYIICQKYS